MPHFDWFQVFKKKDDFVPRSPDSIRECIDENGTLIVESTDAVPASALLWNGIAFRANGTALYVTFIL